MVRAVTALNAAGTVDADEALVAAARAEPEAFAQIYQRHVVSVYRYVRSRAASDEEAADITQAVFIKAMAALKSYRRGTPFVAWLFRIARNASTDAYRRRRRLVGLDALPEPLPDVSADSPEEIALKQERLNRLRGLVARLDKEKQEILALRFGGGLKLGEIAAVMGKSETAIKKQMSRLMAALREQYFEDLR